MARAPKLTWWPVGQRDTPYPPAVLALKGKSGVYAIRRVGWLTSSLLYVGESHTGRLYDTLTRHFQHWRRGKSPKWYPAQYVPESTDPGHTFPRDQHEVAFRVGTPDQALTWQDQWIATLRPTHNRAGVELAEPAPKPRAQRPDDDEPIPF